MKLLDKSYQWPLHMDGIYKRTWQGFSVLILGIIDAQYKSYLMSLSLVSHERTNTYLHLFTVLEDAYTKESSYELDLLFVIANGSIAITVVMRTAFPRGPRGMRWTYVVRNIDKKLQRVKNEEKRKRFRRDLHLL